MENNNYLNSALQTGLSPKASTVYVTLLSAGVALSPKAIILKSKLHRQYVYDALSELSERSLSLRIGIGRRIKYQASSPDTILQQAEKKRLDTINGVQALMKLYDRSPAGIVEVIRGTENCIASEMEMLHKAEVGDFLDIVGGAGMNFVKLFSDKITEWEDLRSEKKISLRYIGGKNDVAYNKTISYIKNESRVINNIGNIVNVCIRPKSVSFNIYEPEIVTVRVRSEEAVLSQRALFEILWNVAK